MCPVSEFQFSLRFESSQSKNHLNLTSKVVGTCAQHVPDGGSPDGGPGTGFGAAFGSPDAATYKQQNSQNDAPSYNLFQAKNE